MTIWSTKGTEMSANSDETQDTPVSACAQYDVRVMEGDKLIQPEDGSQGHHLFRLSGQVAPTFSFTNTDRYQRHGVFTFSFGPIVLHRTTVAPGKTYTLTSERMELFRLSLGEKVYGNLSVSVKWVLQPHEDQKQRDALARAVMGYAEYHGAVAADQENTAKAVALALEDIHARKRHVIINLVFANEAGLVFASTDLQILLGKIMNTDHVPGDLKSFFRHRGVLIDSASLLDLLGGLDLLKGVSFDA